MNNSENMLRALREQNLAEADKYFQQALSRDTKEDLLALADYLESIGFFPQAKLLYERLSMIYPESYLSLARIASEDGEIEQAFTYLEEITPESEWYVSTLLIKADLYQMEGLPDIAREKLVEASHVTDEPLILFGIAELDMELGNDLQAIKTYARLDHHKIYQETGVSTYQRIGVAYARLGRFETAIEFLEKSLELEYEDGTAFELAMILSDQKEYQRANLYFKQIATISPEFLGYEYPYALSLHAEHQTKEALRISQQGLAKNSFDTQLLLLASQLSYELHDEKEAERYLLEAKEVADDMEEIALRLTTMYLKQERFEEVLTFQDVDVDHVLTRWNIARSYHALEKSKEALVFYQELVVDLWENPEFLEQYIYLLRELGEFEEAKKQVQRYLQLVPDDTAMQELSQDF